MIENVITTKDVEIVMADISKALNSLYKHNDGQASDDLHPLVVNILKDSNKDLVSERLIQLRDELTALEIFSITMAFVPRREFIIKIYTWLLNNLGRRVVLSLNLDSALLGGCVISSGGKYFDGSLNRKFEEYFNKKATP